MAGNVDFLPTFVSLAGGTVPKDRKIDGRDISPLLLGRSKESPHEALFFFAGNALQAVRSGPWKLAITRQSENRARKAGADVTNAPGPFQPTLYNLDTDIGERNDLAAQNPEVVTRLHKLVAAMEADLGTNKPGPGVREPGRVDKPVGLWLPGQEPKPGSDSPPDLAGLNLGDTLAGEDAPDIEDMPLTITCEVEAKSPNGVIVAQGGVAAGYSVYLRDGKLQFTVRENSTPVTISANEPVPAAFRLEARLAKDGAMSLAMDGRIVARGKAPGLIPRQPMEDFCVGHDNRMAVGDYTAPARFSGSIKHLKITHD
jgi:hypothetical protein